MGYSLSEAEQTDAYFFEKEERLRIERKKILKEKRIAERLSEKAEEKENLEAQQNANPKHVEEYILDSKGIYRDKRGNRYRKNKSRR